MARLMDGGEEKEGKKSTFLAGSARDCHAPGALQRERGEDHGSK